MNACSDVRSLGLQLAVLVIVASVPVAAQNRGVYHLGMTAVN